MSNLLQEHFSGRNGELQGAQSNLVQETWQLFTSSTALILVHAVVVGHC